LQRSTDPSKVVASETFPAGKRCLAELNSNRAGPRQARLLSGCAQERGNMLSTILIIVLILILIGARPTWPYSSGWGYYPGGGLGLILIIVIVLALMGRI
jgi:hypothetical protein